MLIRQREAGVDLAHRDLNIALVHDWLNQSGGAENVLEEMVKLFPGAPIYTSMYAPDHMPSTYRSWPIETSFMQHLPAIATNHQPYMPLYPLAFSRTDLSQYDLVLSNKSGFCHGVRVQNSGRNGNKNGAAKNGHAHNGFVQNGVHHQCIRRAIHVCYCLTPTRFLWLYEQYREREQIGGLTNTILQPMLALLRRWDWAAAQRVDFFIAISSEIQRRIQQIYGRESIIIHPPVDTHIFTPDVHDVTRGNQGICNDRMITVSGQKLSWGSYYLIVSRLIPYKRIDLAVEAFRHLPNERLVIVGEGRDRGVLHERASSNVLFVGRQSREQILELLRGCKAFIFPGLEDFGIAPVEALSVGRPVIAYRGGGALDTIVPGVTGEFFDTQTADSLYETLTKFDASFYSLESCRAQAERFGNHNFRQKLQSYIREIYLHQVA
ncbi:glycosyltransferase [Chloroflexi bacterium TSY]|nr:glycosyltransferase [Chloroflexi bacterium TSY]